MRKSITAVFVLIFISTVVTAFLFNTNTKQEQVFRDIYDNPFREINGLVAGYGTRPFTLTTTYVVTGAGADPRGSLKPVSPVDIRTGNTSLMRIALTIDDGWNADMRILDLLKSSGIRFTTFLIGGRGISDAHPEFLQAIQDAGGEICNHTNEHALMQGRSREFVVNDIWKAQGTISRTTHRVYPYIRFMGGSFDNTSLAAAAGEGFYHVHWNLSCGDTVTGNTVERQVANVLNGLSPGSIILCHWGGHNTYEVLSIIIPEIQRRGFEVTSLTRVLEGTPYLLNSPR
ncbi:MAG: polysaccharide deacetylase family protein [Actinobacteria bacterium]|nr:polysaccharide deacetylase family protein [Actinomycetota bacterium]